MPDVYASRLPLPGAGRAGFDDAVAAVRREVKAHTGLEVMGDDGALTGGADSVRWHLLAGPETGERVWTLMWDSPVPGDDDLLCAVTVKVGLEAPDAWVIVRQGLLARRVRMSPTQFGLEPLHLVSALADALPAEEDGRPLVTEPWYAPDADATAHLAALLFDPGRVLPVVVVSSAVGDEGAETPLVDVDVLARALVGVAHVVVLGSVSTSFSFTKQVGRPLSVFGGAVRLYWPGMHGREQHPLWLPRSIVERGTPWLSRALLGRLMPVAVVRFSSAPLEARVRAATERQRRAELRSLWTRAREASLAPDWEQELERAWAENDRLQARNAELSEQLSAAHDNLRAMAARWGAGPPQADEAAEIEPGAEDTPVSVLQAVEWAATRCSHLVFLEDAFSSARRATYRQPARVWRALLALEEAVGAWSRDDLEGGFRRALARGGIDYSHTLSAATVGRHPHEYERTYDGKRVVLGPHLRLGRGSPEACCRIYLYLDEEKRRCVVGHVGNHLTDRTTG